jgi:WD40 repeat protein/serine/threonine protein kinase
MLTQDPTEESSVSFQVPDHVLLRQIGRGSYGDVWLGRSVLGTYRAIKIIQRSRFDRASPFDRELEGIRRFEPISRTDEGFVHILQIGKHANDYFYYVMEAADDLAQGQIVDPSSYVPKTLGKAAAKAGRFSIDECIQLGMTLCLALDKLHRHGLVHRDIKPSNVIFINGTPKLADIGLVTDSENAHSFVGTEGFIPPEGPGSKKADIYSLGKTLYEVASGRDRLDFPSLPASLDELPDPAKFLELNEVIIRACRNDPRERYGSAREMYDDLALLVTGKSLRRLHTLERRWKSAKHAVALFAGAVAVSSAVVFPILRERQHSAQMRQRQIGEHSASGSAKMDEGDFSGALSEYSAVFELEAQKPNRVKPNRIRIASLLSATPKLTQMLFLDGKANDLEFSRDGKSLLTVTRHQRVSLLDIQSGREIAGIDAQSVVHASFHPDGNSAIVAEDEDCLSIWKFDAGKLQKLANYAKPTVAKFSPSGKWIGAGFNNGRVRVITPGGETLMEFSHTNLVRGIAFSPNEKLLASSSDDGAATLWDLSTSKKLFSFKHPSWVLDVAFSPDGKLLVTGCADGAARLFRVDTGEKLTSLMKQDDGVQKVAFSPDGMMILTASFDYTVRLWDARSTMRLESNHLFRNSGSVFAAGFSPDAHRIVSGTAEGVIHLWDLATAPIRPQPFPGTYSESGSFAATLVKDGISIRSLEIADAPEIARIPVSGKIEELALSRQDEAVAAAILEGKIRQIRVWHPRSQDQFKPIAVSKVVTRLTLSADGSLLSFLEGDKTTRVFDVSKGTEWTIPEPLRKSWVTFHPLKRRAAFGVGTHVALFENDAAVSDFVAPSLIGDVRNLIFSPDGKQLLICQNDLLINPKPAVLLDAETGKILEELWHRDGIRTGSFQSDGKRLITGGEDRLANIWSADTKKQVLPGLRHSHQILSACFDANGSLIGSTSGNFLTRIWDGETGAPITPNLLCDTYNYRITFIPNQKNFLTFQTTTQAFLWKLPTTDISPDDAVELSHLLNSDWKTVGQPSSAMIAAAWRRIHSQYPQYFTISEDDVIAWHQEQLKRAKAEQRSGAMQFHSLRLSTLRER